MRRSCARYSGRNGYEHTQQTAVDPDSALRIYRGAGRDNFFTFNELKGDSPAVNASGSLRMRAYQLAWGAARLVSADEGDAQTLRTSMQKDLADYDKILAGLAQGDAAMGLTAPSDEEVQRQLAAVKPLWEEYRSNVRAVIEGTDEEARRAAEGKVAQEVAPFVAEVNKLVVAYDAASQTKIETSKDIQLGVILLAIFVVGGALWLILTQILRPLAALTDSFHDISEGAGDLTQQLHAERDDEIGRIVLYFNTFTGKLRTIIRGAQESAAEVAHLAGTLSKASGENSQAVEQVAGSVTNVAGQANAQNGDIQTLADNVTQIAENALAKITEAVGTVRSSLNDIAASSEESRRAAAEIVRLNQMASEGARSAADTSGHVATAAKQIAGLSEESAAAIEEQSATMEQVVATAEQLSGLSSKMDGLVGKFKV